MLAEIERFVNYVRRRSPAAHTWRDYRCDLAFFAASVGDREPVEITFREVDAFIAEQSQKGFNRRLASIAAFYAFLMPEDETLECPVFPRRMNIDRLRHTCATQLLNAGCRITSIQAFLGHKKLNTTMIYARAHDQSVADDYFTAMQRVEQRLEIGPPPKEEEPTLQDEVVKVPQPQILARIEHLALHELCPQERIEIAGQLKRALFLSYAQEHAPPAAVVV
jgi:site-specific recombinase XerC